MKLRFAIYEVNTIALLCEVKIFLEIICGVLNVDAGCVQRVVMMFGGGGVVPTLSRFRPTLLAGTL